MGRPHAPISARPLLPLPTRSNGWHYGSPSWNPPRLLPLLTNVWLRQMLPSSPSSPGRLPLTQRRTHLRHTPCFQMPQSLYHQAPRALTRLMQRPIHPVTWMMRLRVLPPSPRCLGAVRLHYRGGVRSPRHHVALTHNLAPSILTWHSGNSKGDPIYGVSLMETPDVDALTTVDGTLAELVVDDHLAIMEHWDNHRW